MRSLLPASARLMMVVTSALLAGACASMQARTVRPAPLDVPPPPPRTATAPSPDPDLVATTDPSLDVPAEVDAPAPRAPQSTGRTPQPPPAPSPTPAARSEPPPPAPNLTLRPGGASASTVSAQEVMAIIGRATDGLDQVPRHRLTEAARTQYDTARRFVAQAEAAVKVDNLIFARYLAEKAETLAKGLR